MFEQVAILLFAIFAFAFVGLMAWSHIKIQASFDPVLSELSRRYIFEKESLDLTYSTNQEGSFVEILNVCFDKHIVIFQKEDDYITKLSINSDRYHFPPLKRDFLKVFNQMFSEQRQKNEVNS